MPRVQPEALLAALRASWSVHTGRHWLPDNPARGRCNVAALVAHDLLGGEILKTNTPCGWHFYNRVGGVRRDFTDSQFTAPLAYDDVPSGREEALSGTAPASHRLLAERVRSRLAGAAARGD